MSTFKEIIYLINDELKNISNDSNITLEHIEYVANRHRANVIKQAYNSIKKQVSQSAYQNITLTMSRESNYCGCNCMKSNETIPSIMNVGIVRFGGNICSGNRTISFVNRERFAYAGTSRYSGNTIYATIDDGHLWLKSSNQMVFDIDTVTLSAVFEDASEANRMNSSFCDDIWDNRYPLEEAFVPMVVQYSLQELLGALLRPEDDRNNDKDDLSDIHNFIRNNVKSDLSRKIDGTA